jgi:serine/threonine protein kinase
MMEHTTFTLGNSSMVVQVFLTDRHLALAMDFMPGGDLYKYVIRHQPHCRLSEPQARWIFQQLIIGLDFCHRKVSGDSTVMPSSARFRAVSYVSGACCSNQSC